MRVVHPSILRFCLALVLFSLSAASSLAVSVTGADWTVFYNIPDQDTMPATAEPDEYEIRTQILALTDLLGSGDVARYSTFTFSAGSTCCGFAGPLLTAINAALDRGATVGFAVDSDVNISTVYGSYSLSGLSTRPTNPLQLVEDNSTSGIVHSKLAIFDFGGGDRRVVSTSANFTGGAASLQWNIGVELRNAAAHNAYSLEFTEFLAGRFHDHVTKSHAHDDTTFSLAGGGISYVRFAPYPDGTFGGNNASADIVTEIDAATQRVLFALNKLTIQDIADALVDAADRGVQVVGVMPRSDTDPGEASNAIFTFLNNPANYATTNVVQFLSAYVDGTQTSTDDGSLQDLVHTKYMVIDPGLPAATVIHGSANWTISALVRDDSNDEDVLFLRHTGLADAFVSHFDLVTGSMFGAGANTPPSFVQVPGQMALVGATLQFDVQATDGDGDFITLTATGVPVNATFPLATGTGSVTQTFTFAPSLAQSGQVYSVGFQAVDVDGTSTMLVEVTVGGVLGLGCDLMISKYLEGSGAGNKAVEIFNGSEAAIDMDAEDIYLLYYFNGSSSAGVQIELTATLNSGSSYLVVNSGADAALLSQADLVVGGGWFNGDDAVVLRRGGVFGDVVDGLGQVGVDPGTAWGSGEVTTQNHVLWRRYSVVSGDTNVVDAFDPAVQWLSLPIDTWASLGVHESRCSYGPDSDGDGMPDGWELAYFGNSMLESPTNNVDMDALSNLEEYIADTNPTNDLSEFCIEDAQGGGARTFTFTSSIGRLYTLESVAEPYAETNWTAIGTSMPGTNLTTTLAITNVAPTVTMYRVVVEIP